MTNATCPDDRVCVMIGREHGAVRPHRPCRNVLQWELQEVAE
jgi:hypothetical protein